MSATDLETRLSALENIEAIRTLKANYLARCDAKDPTGMRACFADGEVAIDYGVLGCFNRADALVDIFKQIGCHPHMVEMHHGVNPQITLCTPEHAAGRWGLHYQLINTNDGTLTQLGAYYEDEYRKTASGWRISATKCVVTSTLVLKLTAEATQALVIGRMPAA